MYQNLFTGKIAQNVEIIILLVFVSTITSKYVYQLSEKTLFLSVFDFLGLRDPQFQEIRYFCLLEPWGLLFIKFGKSSYLISASITKKSFGSMALIRRLCLSQIF